MLDTRELGRRPGSQRTVTFPAEAPAELGIEILGVPEGSQIDFDLRLEAVMEGVLVTGTASADLVGECARCLEPIEDDVTIDIQELYLYGEPGDGDDEDDDVSRTEGDLVDLEPVLRDAVVLALPFQPLCQDDCPGLCTECGARLADDPGHRHDEPVDPRWATLGQLAATDED
ncbi:YceD family protein [Marmoricola sp. RAF53]|uniref:YceD family protein n=1 Tax=Marmoricola sp. RAF53 TaxID=3233059 RepID=UPI003F94E5CF